MKKFVSTFTVFLPFFISFLSFAQYSVSSPYIINPSLAIGYVDSSAHFWLQTWDTQKGGFYTNIDKQGNVITSWGTNKNMLTQSSNAYGLTRAYMLTGDTTYLVYAKNALDWMYAHAWDNTNGGWFQELDVNGNPISPTGNKTAFYQHYALLGIAAYYEATRDTTAWNWLMKGYQHLENIYWDSRAPFTGYYDKADFNNQNVWDKSFNSTVDAVTAHLLPLYLMTKEDKYKFRLQEIATEIKEHFAASMSQQAIGFVEKFTSEWNWNNNETMTKMGNVLKAVWCLARINQLFPDTSYINTAEMLINDVWTKGYDHDFGGPYKDFNRQTGAMLLWGLQDSTKAWWQMEQAIVAGLQMYGNNPKNLYLQIADETLNFFMNYFVDRQNGEVYADRTRYGGFAWNEAKGNSGKAGYHSIETGYYLYLYGNMFSTGHESVLHYKFYPLPTERKIFLTPLAINNKVLFISQVKRDGQLYTNVDIDKHILTLPAGVGGQFEVTYSTIITNVVSDPIAIVNEFELKQNFPNPFNPTTKIRYKIPSSITVQEIYVKLIVFDVLGNEIAKLVNEEKPAGNYQVDFNASRLASGVYFYRLQAGSFFETKKMILLR